MYPSVLAPHCDPQPHSFEVTIPTVDTVALSIPLRLDPSLFLFHSPHMLSLNLPASTPMLILIPT